MAPSRRTEPVVHHELCFGCGRTNLFGLLLEAERSDAGALSGRCFIKQDHQGPERGFVHPGIAATALVEAMALAAGDEARVQEVTVRFLESAAVGSFLTVDVQPDRREGQTVMLAAVARADEAVVAEARGTYASG
jgi:acyl-coenzyme A thioesterase PaaI-like protein